MYVLELCDVESLQLSLIAVIFSVKHIYISLYVYFITQTTKFVENGFCKISTTNFDDKKLHSMCNAIGKRLTEI